MKNIQKLFALAAFTLCLSVASTSFAASVRGPVTFIGTLPESVSGSMFMANFRIQVTNSSCDGGSVRTRWIHVNAGRMDGAYAHNGNNARNAYSTLVAAFLSGKTIQIDSSSISCSSTATQSINLWSSYIGVY